VAPTSEELARVAEFRIALRKLAPSSVEPERYADTSDCPAKFHPAIELPARLIDPKESVWYEAVE
jgi:hypothetical protein